MGNTSRFVTISNTQSKQSHEQESMNPSTAATITIVSGEKREQQQQKRHTGQNEKSPEEQQDRDTRRGLPKPELATNGQEFNLVVSMESCADNGNGACDNLNEISHSFWLQQYSGLHNELSSRSCNTKTPQKSRHELPGLPAAEPKPSASSSRRNRCRHKLLARWTNLVRTFGGSTSNSLANSGRSKTFHDHEQETGICVRSASASAHSTMTKASGSMKQEVKQFDCKQVAFEEPGREGGLLQRGDIHHHRHNSKNPSGNQFCGLESSGASVQPAAESGNVISLVEADGEQEVGRRARDKKRRGWFMKSLSNSTSTLSAPLGSHSQQQQREKEYKSTGNRLELPNTSDGGCNTNRSQSSCEQGRPFDCSETCGQHVGQSEPLGVTPSPKRSSPYRQIALALTNRTRRAAPAASQQAVTGNGSPSASAKTEGRRKSGAYEAPTKRSRLMQFASFAHRSCSSTVSTAAAMKKKHESEGFLDEPSSHKKGGVSGKPTGISCKQQQPQPQPQQTSILGSIFISPLFRRCDTSTSTSSSTTETTATATAKATTTTTTSTACTDKVEKSNHKLISDDKRASEKKIRQAKIESAVGARREIRQTGQLAAEVNESFNAVLGQLQGKLKLQFELDPVETSAPAVGLPSSQATTTTTTTTTSTRRGGKEDNVDNGCCEPDDELNCQMLAAQRQQQPNCSVQSSSKREFKFQVEMRLFECYANEPNRAVAETPATASMVTPQLTAPARVEDKKLGGAVVSGGQLHNRSSSKNDTMMKDYADQDKIAGLSVSEISVKGDREAQLVMSIEHQSKAAQLNDTETRAERQIESRAEGETGTLERHLEQNVGARLHHANTTTERGNESAKFGCRISNFRLEQDDNDKRSGFDAREHDRVASCDAIRSHPVADSSFLPLIQPLTSSESSSSSSLAIYSSMGCLDRSVNQLTYNQDIGGIISIAMERDGPAEASNMRQELKGKEFLAEERPISQPENLTSGSWSARNTDTRQTRVNNTGTEQHQLQQLGNNNNKQKATRAMPASGISKNEFKKLVKRQQSVDSYRMARDQIKNKLRRQQDLRHKHQSNEAIKTKCAADDQPVVALIAPKLSICGATNKIDNVSEAGALQQQQQPLRICIDPYAKPGSFTLPGEDKMSAMNTTAVAPSGRREDGASAAKKSVSAGKQRGSTTVPKPPNTLSLMPSPDQQPQHGQPGAFIVGSFSGCITPTYPTHHLPSPKYVSVSNKKYSNASTISSSFGGESNSFDASHRNCIQNGLATDVSARSSHLANQSDTESSMGGSVTPSKAGQLGDNSINISILPMNLGSSGVKAPEMVPSTGTMNDARQMRSASISSVGASGVSPFGGALQLRAMRAPEAMAVAASATVAAAAAAAAARRANLAEHIYDNKCGLGEDMKFLASLPELCDITFLVGETREPVCAVKSVLAARSRVFHKILFGNRIRRFARQKQQDYDSESQNEVDRRGSSPKSANRVQLVSKSSSPVNPASRSTSPNQVTQQQWSVTTDASGYSPLAHTGNGSITALPDDPSTSGATRSGRVSVASNSRESIGQGSIGSSSQQPLIIGPGQMAALAKRCKKSATRDSSHHGANRLSRMFMKRASDPSIKQQNQSGNANQSNQNYLDKMSSSQMSATMIIEEFEPDVFRQLIEYIHTGCVLLQARTLLGLLNAADYYGLEQLRRACLRFVSCCITVDTVCSLLSTAERYIQYKCTKSIVQKVLEFVDTHADEIFKLNAFGLLPEHVVRLILARDGLMADEQVKYEGVYTWCEHYCRSYELTNISDVMQNFLDLIQFHKIPTNVLLTEIYPTHIVPDNIFLSALAYQADPQNFEPQPMQVRRMTLPNPTIYKDYDDDDNEDDTGIGDSGDYQDNEQVNDRAKAVSDCDGDDNKRHKLSQKQAKDQAKSSKMLYGSQQTLVHGVIRSRKSTGGQHDYIAGLTTTTKTATTATITSGKLGKFRKGSIAQVSISNVMRLSHKLSIKKRHSNIVDSSNDIHRRGSGQASLSGRLPVRKQQSTDPMQVGKQILNAYLSEKHQRELDEEERRKREQEAADEAKRSRQIEQGTTETQGAHSSVNNQEQKNSSPGSKQSYIKTGSTRKSFKDFRHISRRIFMRHLSSKMLSQQSSTLSSTADKQNDKDGANIRVKDKDRDKDKRRNLIKIKRSETVFETGTTCTTSKSWRLSHQLSSNMPATSK